MKVGDKVQVKSLPCWIDRCARVWIGQKGIVIKVSGSLIDVRMASDCTLKLETSNVKQIP